MAERIQTNLNVTFPGGLTVADVQTADVDAYDKVDVTIGTRKTVTVEVQPSETVQIRFLLIKADKYESTLKYGIVKDKWITLDAIQLFNGVGLLSLLPGAPQKIILRNEGTEDRTVQVLVGRSAIAAPGSTTTSEPEIEEVNHA